MADAAPKKTRKPQGPRVAKPIYILVTYKDENGNTVPLAQERVSITAVKDPVEVIKMFQNGGMNGAAFVSFTPAGDRPAPKTDA